MNGCYFGACRRAVPCYLVGRADLVRAKFVESYLLGVTLANHYVDRAFRGFGDASELWPSRKVAISVESNSR